MKMVINHTYRFQTTQPTSGGDVTVSLLCKLCRTFSEGPIYRYLGKPAMRTRCMAGAPLHKNG